MCVYGYIYICLYISSAKQSVINENINISCMHAYYMIKPLIR